MDHLGSHAFSLSLSLPIREMTGLWGRLLDQEHASVLETTAQALHRLPFPLWGPSEHPCLYQVSASQHRTLDSDPGQNALSLISSITFWGSVEFRSTLWQVGTPVKPWTHAVGSS